MSHIKEQIRQRAFEVWQAHGRPLGFEKVHWQIAEAELNQRLSAQATAAVHTK